MPIATSSAEKAADKGGLLLMPVFEGDEVTVTVTVDLLDAVIVGSDVADSVTVTGAVSS